MSFEPVTPAGVISGGQGQIAAIIVARGALTREALIRTFETFRIVASLDLLGRLDLSSVDPGYQLLFLLFDLDDSISTLIPQIKLFKGQRPDGRAVVVSKADRPDAIASLFHAGADACLGTDVSPAAIRKSVELVMLGERLVPPSLLPLVAATGTAARVPAEDSRPLSAREQQILSALVQGHSNKAIARAVGAAEATVKTHVKAILRKIGAQNRTQAAIWWVNRGVSKGAGFQELRSPPDEGL